MDQIKIGKFLKELRKEKGITQEQLAEILGVSNRTISRWETGNNMPDISLLVVIADFFEVSILEIINGERKSEKMSDETKKVAETLSNYADVEKEKMVREIRNYSIMGVVAIVFCCILKCSELVLQNEFYEKVALLCEIQICISIMITFAYTTGILKRMNRNKRVTKFHAKLKDLPRIVQIIVAAIVALVVSTVIKMILNGGV